jgi:ATPase subunit of ABC transporter with duplicated ATPase domains
MSRTKERKLRRQREKEEKLREQIRTGQVRYVRYEQRNKKSAMPNRINMAESPEAELEDRQDTVERATVVYRQMLPSLLKKLSRIKDPRNPFTVSIGFFSNLSLA